MQILLSSDTYGALDAIMFFAGLFRHLGVLFVSILSLVAYVKIYMKMGEPWWTAIIPIYSVYVLAKRIKAKTEFWISLGITVACVVLYAVLYIVAIVARSRSNFVTAMFLAVLVFIFYSFVQVIISYIFNYKLSKAFGQGHGFAVGLLFLNAIFSILLAFGNYNYVYEDNKTYFEKEFEEDSQIDNI